MYNHTYNLFVMHWQLAYVLKTFLNAFSSLCKMVQSTCASKQRANLFQRGNGDASKVGGWVGLFVYVHGLCDGKLWNISLLSSFVDIL